MRKIYRVVSLLIFSLFFVVGCAEEPVDARAAVINYRASGEETKANALEQELNNQKNRFALFRSYQKTKEIMSGSYIPVPSDMATLNSSVQRTIDNETGIVCYYITRNYGEGSYAAISCVRPQ